MNPLPSNVPPDNRHREFEDQHYLDDIEHVAQDDARGPAQRDFPRAKVARKAPKPRRHYEDD